MPFKLLRRLTLGKEVELVDEAIEWHAAREPPSPEEVFLSELEKWNRKSKFGLLLGHSESGAPVRYPVEKLGGVHRWITGATGSGKSAQVMAEEIQLIQPNAPWSLFHLDAKSESATWLTDIFLPAIVWEWEKEEAIRFLGGLMVINPFDPKNIPPLNILLPDAGTSVGLQAKEISGLISEALGSQGGTWGPRMRNILSFAIRAALDLKKVSLMEVRAMLMQPEYLQGVIPYIRDRDVKEYFALRFDQENKEAVRAVISRLDLLLIEQTARVLCAPSCIDFSSVLERPLSIVDVGMSPRGGEFLSNWWMSVIVNGLTKAILSRQDTQYPVFCALDEWWMALDLELVNNFERLLTLARYKNVGLWLINQLAGQVGSRSPLLLSTIKNSCGLQTAFRQSHEDAQGMAYMLPTSETMRVKKTPDSMDWDTRVARPEEQRKMLVEELVRLPSRTSWLYPKIMGQQAVKLTAPTVPFGEARKLAASRPHWFRDLCRGYGQGAGLEQEYLDEVLEIRREHIYRVAQGIERSPIPDFERKSYELSPPQERELGSAESNGQSSVRKEPSQSSDARKKKRRAESDRARGSGKSLRVSTRTKSQESSTHEIRAKDKSAQDESYITKKKKEKLLSKSKGRVQVEERAEEENIWVSEKNSQVHISPGDSPSRQSEAPVQDERRVSETEHHFFDDEDDDEPFLG